MFGTETVVGKWEMRRVKDERERERENEGGRGRGGVLFWKSWTERKFVRTEIGLKLQPKKIRERERRLWRNIYSNVKAEREVESWVCCCCVCCCCCCCCCCVVWELLVTMNEELLETREQATEVISDCGVTAADDVDDVLRIALCCPWLRGDVLQFNVTPIGAISLRAPSLSLSALSSLHDAVAQFFSGSSHSCIVSNLFVSSKICSLKRIRSSITRAWGAASNTSV